MVQQKAAVPRQVKPPFARVNLNILQGKESTKRNIVLLIRIVHTRAVIVITGASYVQLNVIAECFYLLCIQHKTVQRRKRVRHRSWLALPAS